MVISTVDVTSNEKYFGGNIFCRVYVLPVVKKFEIITKIKTLKIANVNQQQFSHHTHLLF